MQIFMLLKRVKIAIMNNTNDIIKMAIVPFVIKKEIPKRKTFSGSIIKCKYKTVPMTSRKCSDQKKKNNDNISCNNFLEFTRIPKLAIYIKIHLLVKH